MSSPENMTVQGTTAITYVDNMYMTWRQSLGRLPIYVIALSIALMCGPIIFVLMHPDSIPAQEPVREIGRSLYKNWEVPIIGGLAYLLFMQICSAVSFWRRPIAARTLTYAADAVGMRFTNDQGSSALMPWTTIKRGTRERRFIILRPKMGPMLFIALRAFADPDRLWNLVTMGTARR